MRRSRTYYVTSASGAISYSPSALGAASAGTNDITIPGVMPKEGVRVMPPAAGTGHTNLLLLDAWIPSAGTVRIKFFNTDGAPQTPTTPTTTAPWVVTVF